MYKSLKFPVIMLAVLFCCLVSGCPEKEDDTGDINFKVGTWAGSINTEARLILREEPQYWCAGWKMEANEIRLVQYQDGSLKGEVVGNLFHWSVYDSRLLDFQTITSGHYDMFTTFTLELEGHVDEGGYELEVVELPLDIPDPDSPTGTIQFWDFLFPSRLQGTFSEPANPVMTGESIRPQGNDYPETSSQPNFREFSIKYTWEIEKL